MNRDETTSLFGSEVPDVTKGGTTSIDADVPAWIRENFTGIRAYMQGDNVVIQTRGLPPYKTYYYSNSGKFASMRDTGHRPELPNPNSIVELAVTLIVPAHPQLASPDLKANQIEAGLGIVGVARNGVVIFNDEANPPDAIQNEVKTFDRYGGHPTGRGEYHYHDEPVALVPSSGPKNELIGIAIDGFPIYGSQNAAGTNVFDAGGSPTQACTTTDASKPYYWPETANNWTTNELDPTPSGLPHYRAVSNFYLATVKDTHGGNSKVGVVVPVFYLIGKYLGGTRGQILYGAKNAPKP